MNLFAKPQMLWLLLILVGPLCVFLLWSWKTKQKLIAQFVQSRLLSNLTVGVSQTRQKLRLVLLASAVLFLVLAMARPQWGFSWEEARQQGLDIVVAIDTSRSMLAEDIAPNRLDRAKLAALDLMRLAKSDRLGLVAFAGSAFLQCPLTLDEEAFRESVEALDVGIIPQGGTALTEAIQSALGAFEKGSQNYKVLVLFTDGEDHDSGALASAEKAAKEGLQIFTIGVGTAEGELIRVQDEQGNSGFLKDEAGNAVKSRLDETLLQKIATAAKGFYLPLRGAKAMETLYAKGLAPLPKSDSTTKLVRQYRERFQWPLGFAIALLVLEMFLPQRKRVAAVAVKETNRAASVGLAVLLFLLGSFAAKASPSGALREYEAGNFHSALDEFKQLSQEKTNDLRLSYNAGAAAYRAKQFDDAEKFFGQATAAPDLALQEKAYYNLGNTLFQAGARVSEPDKKQESWEGSAKSFENALKLNPQDKDAKNNLEVVKKKLEELKKQQQQQQQSKNDKNKNQKDNREQQKNQDQSQQEQNKDSQSEEKKGEKKDNSQQSKQDSEKKESDQQKKSEQKQQKESQQQKQGEGQEKPGEKEAAQQAAAAMMNGKMTPEQARQFLDAQKQEDKALIFAPPKNPTANRHVKDW